MIKKHFFPLLLCITLTAALSAEASAQTAAKSGTTAIPAEFSLDQNYPNPFNPSTTVAFSLPVAAQVSIKVSDILGREVATVLNAPRAAGKHTVQFSAGNLPSGLYFYKIVATAGANTFSETKRMILTK